MDKIPLIRVTIHQNIKNKKTGQPAIPATDVFVPISSIAYVKTHQEQFQVFFNTNSVIKVSDEFFYLTKKDVFQVLE